MSGKNTIYLICFLLVFIVPPFGVLCGIIMTIVHYTERWNNNETNNKSVKQPTPMEYEAIKKADLKRAEEISKRNRERNLRIKS